MPKTKNTSWDSEDNMVTSNFAKFNVPLEDKVMGTLIAKRQVKSNLQGKEGELVWVYDLIADEGCFHALDERKKVIDEPIIAEPGSYWSVGGKPGIDNQMRNIKIGQKCGFKFIDETPSKTKGFNPSKNIRVFTPKNPDGSVMMDDAWLESQNDGFGSLAAKEE